MAAQRSVRIALLILLVPAVYNFICFNFPSNANQIDVPFRSVFYRTFNLIGLVLIASAIWRFGLPVLEFVTGGIHSIVARNSKIDDWKATLYIIVRRLSMFSIPGAALWALWVAMFFQLQFNFFAVSVPIGIGAHLLAAGLYVPLIYRWYIMERSARRIAT